MDSENSRESDRFWFAIGLVAATLGCLYWLWRRQNQSHPRLSAHFSDDASVAPLPPSALVSESEPQSLRQPIQLNVRRKDDLTRIKGVGQVFASRLNEADIYSFADLAAMTEEELRTRLNLAVWQGQPAEWIAQAGRLM